MYGYGLCKGKPTSKIAKNKVQYTSSLGTWDSACENLSFKTDPGPATQVLQPAVAAYQGWVKLEKLRQDPNIVLYFSNILQKPVGKTQGENKTT